MRKSLRILAFLLFMVIAPYQALTQDGGICPELVLRALDAVGELCSDLGRNTACYGYNQVGATFYEEVPDDFFDLPSDQSDVNILQNIRTSPMNSGNDEWGVAVLNVQANIPDTLPGQAVRFLLMGDTEVTNQVPPSAAIQPTVTITASVNTNANVRSGPGRNNNVLEVLPTGTQVIANGLSDDATWVRIIFDESNIGWISRDLLIEAEGSIDDLPISNEVPFTPLQAFQLRTGFTEPECREAPSLMVVQGPENTRIQIEVNGVDIELGSTIVLRTINQNTQMNVATLDGSARIGNLVIAEGFNATADLDEEGDVDGNFGGLSPIPLRDLQIFQTLENVPGNILNYDINVQDRPSVIQTAVPTNDNPQPLQTQEPTVSGNAECGGFRATSPVEGLFYGGNTFYWDPAPGATSYRVTVVGFTSIDVGAGQTNAFIDLYNVGTNFQMSWYVEALVDGQVACTSQTVTIPREASPPPFTAGWQCLSTTELEVYWDNAPPGNVTIVIYSAEITDTRTSPPGNGNARYELRYASGGYVEASGQRVDLAAIYCDATS
jgi:hypothetical protein